MGEYGIEDVDFAVGHDLPPNATPVDVRDEIVWLPDGLTLEITLPDGESVVAGVCLRYLIQWYAQVSGGESGALSHAHGHWLVSHDDGRVTLDLSERVRHADGSESVDESGPHLVGSRTALRRELEKLIDASFDILERRGVVVDDVVAEVASEVDAGDPDLLSKRDPDA